MILVIHVILSWRLPPFVILKQFYTNLNKREKTTNLSNQKHFQFLTPRSKTEVSLIWLCRETWLKLNLLTVSCKIYIENLQSVCGLIWWLLSQRRGFGCRVINGTNITSLTRVCTSLPIRNVKISRNLSRPEISPRSVRYTRPGFPLLKNNDERENK